jgi:hypothetical protein
MEPVGPAQSYKFPKMANRAEIDVDDVLMRIPPPAARSRRTRNFSISFELILTINNTLNMYMTKNEFLCLPV